MDYIEDLKYTRQLQQIPHVLMDGIDMACVKGVGIALSQLFKSHEHMISHLGDFFVSSPILRIFALVRPGKNRNNGCASG